MPITKQRTLEYVEQEWGTYVERFKRLPRDEQERRIQATGYESFRDLLAHLLGWWDEGMEIILAIVEDRPRERREYDFDVFNAESIAKYKDWNEAAFMDHFEKTRQKMRADLMSMDEAVFENHRVQAWIHAVIIHHAREHLITMSPFLVVDMLENEWGTYLDDFNHLDDNKQREFLSKQGFESLHDLLVHIVGWWEDGARIVTGILDRPAFTWESRDVDAFNAELIQRYASWSDDDLLNHFETVRLALIDLIADLPQDAFMNSDIEGWLRDDVVEHYDEHPIPS